MAHRKFYNTEDLKAVVVTTIDGCTSASIGDNFYWDITPASKSRLMEMTQKAVGPVECKEEENQVKFYIEAI